MKIDNIWMKESDYNMYIEKDGKIYRTSVTPYRIIQENELQEIKSPLPTAMYIKANHLFKPSGSFLAHDLKVYGLEM
nr:MAG TPA: hypothetical protein [Caudoviricetes sp.]